MLIASASDHIRDLKGRQWSVLYYVSAFQFSIALAFDYVSSRADGLHDGVIALVAVIVSICAALLGGLFVAQMKAVISEERVRVNEAGGMLSDVYQAVQNKKKVTSDWLFGLLFFLGFATPPLVYLAYALLVV